MFEKGTVVRLRTGGPEMTVSRSDLVYGTEVQWFVGNILMSSMVNPDNLIEIDSKMALAPLENPDYTDLRNEIIGAINNIVDNMAELEPHEVNLMDEDYVEIANTAVEAIYGEDIWDRLLKY
jgi:uncharacterized protein YodC (DUF2158 family)